MSLEGILRFTMMLYKIYYLGVIKELFYFFNFSSYFF
jgi:hypothetical protein